MRGRGDHHTLDLFDAPPLASRHPGGLAGLKTQIPHLMSHATRESGMNRYAIAAGMSELLGEEVSKTMLDAYTAESRDDQNIPAYRLFAFILITESFAAFDQLVQCIGCRILVGDDVKLAALAKMEASKRTLDASIRSLRKQIKGGRHG